MNKNNSTNHKEKDKYDDYSNSFSIYSSLLTDRQRKLIESVKRDYLPQVLDKEFTNEDDSDKADLIKDESERLIHNMEIVLKHLQRIHKIELNLIKLSENYNNEVNPYIRTIIREHLIAIHYYLSAYYEALKDKLLTV